MTRNKKTGFIFTWQRTPGRKAHTLSIGSRTMSGSFTNHQSATFNREAQGTLLNINNNFKRERQETYRD